MRLIVKKNKDGSKEYSFKGFKEFLIFLTIVFAAIVLLKGCLYEEEINFQKEKMKLELELEKAKQNEC